MTVEQSKADQAREKILTSAKQDYGAGRNGQGAAISLLF